MPRVKISYDPNSENILVDGRAYIPLDIHRKQVEKLSNDVLARRVVDLTTERNALTVQVEQLRGPLRNLINVEHERGGSLQIDGQFAYKVKERIFKDAANALDKTPAQCLAEIKAQAGRDGYLQGIDDWMEAEKTYTNFSSEDGADQYANQIRQQAKAGK